MSDILTKLRPDRDLQCYFHRPSSIAAMHGASAIGFDVSGTWRQQFDWVVIEWNRDNVFEHPAFRNLPDGDLSGLQLSYEESRTGCIPLDSDIYPTVDWPYLRVWAEGGSGEEFFQVPLKNYAAPIEGGYTPAFAELELVGGPTTGDYAGISFLGEHHTYQLFAGDTLETTVQALVDSVNTFSSQMVAARSGTCIRLTYVGPGQTLETSQTGANGNRIGVYGFVAGARTETWNPWWSRFAGGVSPSRWRITLPFDSLVSIDGRRVPMRAVRKMRWTYSADLQDGEFQRTDFSVQVSNWTVAGANGAYLVAGPGSRRIEDDAAEVRYSGGWAESMGNFSGGTIHFTTEASAEVEIRYRAAQNHSLYLGTRSAFNGARIRIAVDGGAATDEDLLIAGEDVLRRVPLGEYGPGEHSVRAQHDGPEASYFYFDFLETAVPSDRLRSVEGNPKLSLATDWDTDHSIALPAERTAWLVHSLGFHGRVNHYVGALWFYELYRQGHTYASATVDFVGTPEFSQVTELRIGRTGEAPEKATGIAHVNRIGDTAETIAKAFELELNRGYTAIRAESQGNRLVIYSRSMGVDGNAITISATPAAGPFLAQPSGPTLTGGANGEWRTDLAAAPRLNRAVRDWSRAFYLALKDYGLDVVAAFSMELQHGDPSTAAGVAQRYPNGEPVLLSTPALQTNFSPQSTHFWKEAYREMAGLLTEAGHRPYLQFGEVQWWYFPLAGSGMPFYDAYTTGSFLDRHGRTMRVVPTNEVDPAEYVEEVEFLREMIGTFTSQVISHVRASFPDCRFEVLYPTDVNQTPFNSLVNYPDQAWIPTNLECLKTESFTYTYTRNLNASLGTIVRGKALGFSTAQRSFLVGISDSRTPWMKEVRYALSENVESVVLFALDQFCLIGYPVPLPKSSRRSVFLG